MSTVSRCTKMTSTVSHRECRDLMLVCVVCQQHSHCVQRRNTHRPDVVMQKGEQLWQLLDDDVTLHRTVTTQSDANA